MIILYDDDIYDDVYRSYRSLRWCPCVKSLSHFLKWKESIFLSFAIRRSISKTAFTFTIKKNSFCRYRILKLTVVGVLFGEEDKVII